MCSPPLLWNGLRSTKNAIAKRVALNVIGRQSLEPDLEEAMLQAMLTMLRELPSSKEEASIPESTIRALCAAYQPEVNQLIDAGLLVPQQWRHYPHSEV